MKPGHVSEPSEPSDESREETPVPERKRSVPARPKPQPEAPAKKRYPKGAREDDEPEPEVRPKLRPREDTEDEEMSSAQPSETDEDEVSVLTKDNFLTSASEPFHLSDISFGQYFLFFGDISLYKVSLGQYVLIWAITQYVQYEHFTYICNGQVLLLQYFIWAIISKWVFYGNICFFNFIVFS